MASKKRMLQHSDPVNDTFGQSLDWHLARGTRPEGSAVAKGVPWGNKDFAKAVGAKSSEGTKNERTIRNWRKSETHPSPADFHAILLALFGANADYAAWKDELTNQYHAGRADAADRPSPALSHRRESRPAKPLRCLGRDDDLKPAVDGLTAASDSIAILVLGGAGMGKTTLTRQAANEPAVVARFGERRWFVELETAPDAASVETAIVAALGLDPAQAKIDAAIALLAAASCLLVLDNLETPYEGAQAALEQLLARLHRVPGLALLASIRGNEPPHGLRWSRQRTMNPLYDPFDRALFLDIANDIKADDPDLAPLLIELGGVPLAIELVAHQAASHDTLAAIYAQWRKVGVALAQRRGTEASRLTALDHSLELSVQSVRLGDAGARLFGFLGLSPAGLCGEDIDGLLGSDAFAARQGVLDCGLGFERDGRLDLLPPVRDFARRLHPPPNNDDQLWRNHFLALAQDRGEHIGGQEGAAALRRLMQEMPNLDAALRAGITAGELDSCKNACFGIALTMAWSGRGTPASIRDLAASCKAAADILGEADCIQSLGDIAFRRSDHDDARKAYEEALPLYRQVGTSLGEANCIRSLGDIALERSDHDAARKAYDEALPLFRQVGDILGEANCIRSLGDVALRRSDLDAASKAYEETLPVYRKVGDILGEAVCIARLGEIALARSDHDAARKAYEKALPLFRKVGDILGEANCIARLGEIALARSDHDAARKAYEEARPLYRQVGTSLGEANCIQSLGNIALERFDHDAARKAYEQALPLYRQVGDILGEANCIQFLGAIALESSDHDAARKAYEQALGLYERIAEPYSIGGAHLLLANVTGGAEKTAHLAAAREAWLSIDRPDLVATWLDDKEPG